MMQCNIDQVRASHILIKHNESRNPKSRLSNCITRSKDEARGILSDLREQISQGTLDFNNVAKEKSDCSSGTRGGDLGPFARGAMQKPFEDASFALTVGQLSEIIDTESGLHIITRTA